MHDFPTTERELREAQERHREARRGAARESQSEAMELAAGMERLIDRHAEERFTATSPQGLVSATVDLRLRPQGVWFTQEHPLRRLDRETLAEELATAMREAQRQAAERLGELGKGADE